MRRGGFVAALACVLGAAAVPAARAQGLAPVPEPRPASRALSWSDCVELALRRNPDLASALRASEASRASFRRSLNGLMPSLALSNSYSSGSSGGGRASYSAQAAASLSLFDMGKVAAIRSAAAERDQAQAGLRRTSADLRFDLRQAYVQLIFAETSVEVARRIVELRRRGAEMVTLRYDSGREYKGNMMNAQAQRLQAEADLAQAGRRLRAARRALDRRLGFDDFEEVSATGTLAAAEPPSPPERVDDLAAGRPDVALREAVLRAARAAVASSESPLWPSLTADYVRSRSGAAEFPSRLYGWSAGATLSYPLFGAGPTSAYFATRAAKRGLEKAEADLRSARAAAVADIEAAWASYAGAADRVRVQQAVLASARQRNDEADVRYASGLMSFDNWELIVSARVASEQQAIQSELDAVVAQAAWEKSLGAQLGEEGT